MAGRSGCFPQHEATECPRLRNQETGGLSAGCGCVKSRYESCDSREEVSTTRVVARRQKAESKLSLRSGVAESRGKEWFDRFDRFDRVELLCMDVNTDNEILSMPGVLTNITCTRTLLASSCLGHLAPVKDDDKRQTWSSAFLRILRI